MPKCSRSLTHLDISWNQVTKVMPEFFMASFELLELVLSNNPLATISSEIGFLKKLSFLDIREVRFDVRLIVAGIVFALVDFCRLH